MKVIDARSGREVKIGDVVDYGDGEGIEIIDIYPGLFSASALIKISHHDYTRSRTEPSGEVQTMEWEESGERKSVRVPMLRVVDPGPLVTITREIELAVKWLHPRFFLQHVAFIPS